MILCLTLVIALFTTIPAHSEATSYKGKVVGIIISKSCLMSDHCLKYKDIKDLDNSNPIFTGKLIEKNGDIKRQATSNQNNYRWLDFTHDYTIMIDPPFKFYNQIPLIEIVSSLDEYHGKGQMAVTEYKETKDAKATAAIRSYSHTRYVDSTCTNAVITAKDWKRVLPDTIDYMRHNCDPKHTQLKTISTEATTLYKHDLATSSKWKLDKFYEEVKSKCTKARNVCTEITNKATTTNSDSK